MESEKFFFVLHLDDVSCVAFFLFAHLHICICLYIFIYIHTYIHSIHPYTHACPYITARVAPFPWVSSSLSVVAVVQNSATWVQKRDMCFRHMEQRPKNTLVICCIYAHLNGCIYICIYLFFYIYIFIYIRIYYIYVGFYYPVFWGGSDKPLEGSRVKKKPGSHVPNIILDSSRSWPFHQPLSKVTCNHLFPFKQKGSLGTSLGSPEIWGHKK